MTSIEKAWIASVQEDLESLRTEERFQRHEPEYYAERQYRQEFFDYCPDALLTSKAMMEYFRVYNTGGSLYDAVKKFLEVHEEECKQDEV